MGQGRKKKVILRLSISLAVITAVAMGSFIGFAFAFMKNVDIQKDFQEYQPALPTQIFDQNGELITEIFSDEKREIVRLNELPKNLIYALLSREDSNFFNHNGVDFFHIARAFYNNIAKNYFSGGSTVTMQVAGRRYLDRSDISYTRKIKEIWYAWMVEKALTKEQILETYLNEVYFGHNCWGVEAASQFYFKHSAREITPAESAILVIQLANPARYSPINHPERAKSRQIIVLNEMVEKELITREEAEISLAAYWDNYDYERTNIASAYFDNNSKAPYFSEKVRLELNNLLYGATDVNTDGYIIHTTLDMNYQRKADDIMSRAYGDVNSRYQKHSKQRLDIVDANFIPIIDLLSLAFNIEEIKVAGSQEKRKAVNSYYEELNPSLNMLSTMFGLQELNRITKKAFRDVETNSKKNTVEGALICLENNTGRVLAMVGGSDYETKQFNRATDATVQPGSSFKPLYYSAAISNRVLTPASRIYDGPVVFFADDDAPYEPNNFLGEWKGSVLLRYALATSMNVPSVQVLDAVGFEAAINRASTLLGMEEQKHNKKLFPRKYPLALGVTATAPINVARAFSTFPSRGQRVEPCMIISIKDREGNIVLAPEEDLNREKQENENLNQIMTPQEAYIMCDLLQSTVEFGTLMRRRIGWSAVDGFDEVWQKIPMGGKTGTTDNWQDAWTAGFSPYVTTVVWFGFDTPGISLGRYLTGATVAGPVWAEYMTSVHENLPSKDFTKPETGLISVKVCSESGLLPMNICPHTKEELFLIGTEPKIPCNVHPFEQERDSAMIKKLQDSMLTEDVPLNEMKLDNKQHELIDIDIDDSDENPLLD